VRLPPASGELGSVVLFNSTEHVGMACFHFMAWSTGGVDRAMCRTSSAEAGKVVAPRRT